MDPNNLDFQTKVFQWFARRSPRIIKLFLFPYLLIILTITAGYFFYFTNVDSQLLIYELGKNLGRTAIILLGIVVLPGILGRFRVEIRLTRIITLFRRQLGITIFLLAFAHYSFVKSLSSFVAGTIPIFNLALFELFGLLALTILFFMFLTSNNLSQKKLGVWWKRLHRFVYVALWLLVLHTGFQRISIFSLYIFAFASLEVISWIFYFATKKTLSSPSTN